MLAGVASFAGMDAIGKWAVRDFSVFQVLAVRSVVAGASLLLAAPFFGRRRWIAVAVGFLGMLLVAQPTGRGFRPEALLVLLASFSYSLMMVLTRWMAGRSGGKGGTFPLLAP